MRFKQLVMPVKFVFLLLPQLHILDLAGADQAIHEAIDFGADYTIHYCSIGKTVKTSSGLPLDDVPHFSLLDIDAGDFLMIPGASYQYLTSSAFQQETTLLAWIKTLHGMGVYVCSICLGAFVLAESGLLDGRSCTTHFKKTKELQAKYPNIKVIENILFTDENQIYTSAGIAAGIDLTLHIIEKLNGSYFAHKVARELVVYHRRKGEHSQLSELMTYRNHIHAGIHSVQDYIVDHIHIQLYLSMLAEIATMSERNFTRVFKKETGVSVKEYITTIRRAKATELLKNLDLSKTKVANMIGLRSEKQLNRILNR